MLKEEPQKFKFFYKKIPWFLFSIMIPSILLTIVFSLDYINEYEKNLTLFLLATFFMIFYFIFAFMGICYLAFFRIRKSIDLSITYELLEAKVKILLQFMSNIKGFLNLGTYFFFIIFEGYKFLFIVVVLILLVYNFVAFIGFVFLLILLFLPTSFILGLLSNKFGIYFYFLTIRIKNGHLDPNHKCECIFTVPESNYDLNEEEVSLRQKMMGFKEKLYLFKLKINIMSVVNIFHPRGFITIAKNEKKAFQFAYPYVIRSLTVTLVSFTILDIFLELDMNGAILLFFLIFLTVGMPMIFSRRFYTQVQLRKINSNELVNPIDEFGEIVGEPSSKLATIIFYSLIITKVLEFNQPFDIISFLPLIFGIIIIIQMIIALFISFCTIFFDNADNNIQRHINTSRFILSTLPGVTKIKK